MCRMAHMPIVTQLNTYRWRSEDIALCILRVTLDDLAARAGLVPESWIEDGLGPHRGALCRLRSGRIASLVEAEALVERGQVGPTVSVEVEDVATHGVAALVAEIVAAFSLAPTDVAWAQESEIVRFARARVEWLAAARAANATGQPAPTFDFTE